VITEVAKKKISKSLTGRKWGKRSPKWCAAITKGKTGKPSKLKGRKMPLSQRRNIGLGNTGKETEVG
jgi:hypothetical protein